MLSKKDRKKGRNRECIQTRSRAEDLAELSGDETHDRDGQVDASPDGQSAGHSAGHSPVKEQCVSSELKDVICKEITKVLLSGPVIDQIVDSVYETVCKRLEEKISQNVHDGLLLELESKKREVRDVKDKMVKLEQCLDREKTATESLEQYTRRNSLRIYGIPESQNENTDKIALNFFKDKLDLDLMPTELDRSHRVTPRPRPENGQSRGSENRPRAVIVKFVRYNMRMLVYQAKSKLRGSKIYIKEDLTSSRQEIVGACVNKIKEKRAKRVWTQDGRVLVLSTNDKVEIERLPEPYGLCKEDTKENIEDNIYYQNYNMSYSIQTCEQSCYQRAMIRICGCSDPSYPSPLYHNVTFYPCDIDNDKETSCLHETGHRYENGSLGCVCQTACHDFSYLPTISSATWPSDNYEKKLFEKMIRSNEEMKRQIRGQSPSVWTRSNMAKLEIYFDEFNYEYIRQDPAYTIPDLLSDMGGQLGLWLGLSVITIFEIFEGVWVMISFFCSRNRSRTRPMQTIPTSTFKARAEKSPPPAYDAAYDAHFAEKK